MLVRSGMQSDLTLHCGAPDSPREAAAVFLWSAETLCDCNDAPRCREDAFLELCLVTVPLPMLLEMNFGID
jgi:hypothetical protein